MLLDPALVVTPGETYFFILNFFSVAHPFGLSINGDLNSFDVEQHGLTPFIAGNCAQQPQVFAYATLNIQNPCVLQWTAPPHGTRLYYRCTQHSLMVGEINSWSEAGSTTGSPTTVPTKLPTGLPTGFPNTTTSPPPLIGTCVHSLCEAGERLTLGCSPAVNIICQTDPFCCNVTITNMRKHASRTYIHYIISYHIMHGVVVIMYLSFHISRLCTMWRCVDVE